VGGCFVVVGVAFPVATPHMHLARPRTPVAVAVLADVQLAKRRMLRVPPKSVAVAAGLELRKDRTRPARLSSAVVLRCDVVRLRAAAVVSDAEHAVAPHEKRHKRPALVGAFQDSSIRWTAVDVGKTGGLVVVAVRSMALVSPLSWGFRTLVVMAE
jgi:hypothetical protein